MPKKAAPPQSPKARADELNEGLRRIRSENMPRGPTRFKQRDVMRAIKAARAAGCAVQTVKIEKDGSIIVSAGSPTDPHQPAADDLDRELAVFELHHGPR